MKVRKANVSTARKTINFIRNTVLAAFATGGFITVVLGAVASAVLPLVLMGTLIWWLLNH